MHFILSQLYWPALHNNDKRRWPAWKKLFYVKRKVTQWNRLPQQTTHAHSAGPSESRPAKTGQVLGICGKSQPRRCHKKVASPRVVVSRIHRYCACAYKRTKTRVLRVIYANKPSHTPLPVKPHDILGHVRRTHGPHPLHLRRHLDKSGGISKKPFITGGLCGLVERNHPCEAAEWWARRVCRTHI